MKIWTCYGSATWKSITYNIGPIVDGIHLDTDGYTEQLVVQWIDSRADGHPAGCYVVNPS